MWLIWILIYLALLALILFHAIAYSIRWYEEARKRGDEHSLWELSPRNALSILAELICHALVLLLLAADLIVTLRKYPWRLRKPLTEADAAPPTLAPTPERPVVLLHGLGMRGLTMWPLARRLRRGGRKVHLFTYWPPGRPVEAYARQLHDFLEELRRKGGYDEFCAVGHSMGGLVARQYLALYEGARRVKHLVTLGTPHGGSELWRFSPFASGRQLRPGGEMLRRLDAAGLPPGVQATAIASDFDELVVPNANARWEAPGVQNVTVSNAGHAQLIFHGETYRHIRQALT